MNEFKNITSNPDILNGKPCVKGTRISVEMILEWLSSGGSISTIVPKHPRFTEDLVKEAILYASKFAKNEIVIEVSNRA